MRPLALALLLLCSSPAWAQRTLIEHTESHGAIVRVKCPMPENRYCFGSGVLLDGDHMLTALHCIKNRTLRVFLPDQEVAADVIAIHPSNDWALLKFRQTLTGVPPMRIREQPLAIGDTVYGYGFGKVGWFGYTRAVYRGGYVEGCLIEEGDSGGPVLDTDGRLVGLATEYDLGTCKWRGHALASDAFRRFVAVRGLVFDNVLVVD